jgi:hypothetical protein
LCIHAGFTATSAPWANWGITKEKNMRKLILIALAGAGIALAAPQLASATPLSVGGGLSTAADSVSSTEQVWYRRHRHCWHRRHWSGRRCW